MSRGDIKLHAPASDEVSIRALTAISAGISAGEPTLSSDATTATTGVVKLAADADPTTASGHRFTGIAKSDSSDTAAATGYVDVWLPIPGTIYSGKSLLASTTNTQAKLDALKFKRTVFDLTASVYTVDAAAADALANGLVIIGGDYTKSVVYFLIIPSVSIFGATN